MKPDRWSYLVVDHPLVVIFVVLLVTLAAAWQLPQFDYNNDPRIFFTEDNPDYKIFREIEDRFTANEIVLFVIHPRNDEVFTAQTLSAIEALTEEAWTLPFSTRVESITNYHHTEVDDDLLLIEPLVENAGELDSDEVARIRDIALNEPALIGRLVSERGHVTAVSVTFTMSHGSKEAPEITEAARQMAERYNQAFPDVDFMLTGTVVFSEATKEATDRSLKYTLPLSFAAMLFFLVLILRSLMFTLVTVLLVMLSILVATGAAIVMGMEFSPIVGMAPAMVLTLAVANSIHVFATYRHQRLTGASTRDGLLESLRVNIQPVWLTSLTTAIGFAMLNFSESQPFRALGTIVMIGVLAAFALSVTLLPAFIQLIPHRISVSRQTDYEPLMDRFGAWVVRHSRWLIVFVGLVTLATTASVPLNQINDVFNEYFDQSYDVRRVNDFAMREMTGMHRIDYGLHAGEPGGTMEPEFLKALDELAMWLESQEQVVWVSGYHEIIKRLNQNMNGGDPAYYRIPDSRELISQYTLMYELSLPQGLGLENQLDMNREYARLIVVLDNIGSHRVLDFNDRVEQWMRDSLPAGMAAEGTGMDVLFGRVTMMNIQSMIMGAVIALVTVSLLLMIALRSWYYGLLSLLPNLLPAGVAFGLWAWINGEIGLAVSVVGCMTLGIVVDDTVHFISKYLRARRELGLSTEAAVRYAFRTVGIALIATSVVLIANFAVIGTSSFYPNSSMGQLSAITIGVALLVDFFFFVPLIVLLDQWRQRRRQRMAHTDS